MHSSPKNSLSRRCRRCGKAEPWRCGRARGSVLVEAALILTFFLVPLFMGLVQFGAFYTTTNSLSQITREAGRLTAIYGHTAVKVTDVGSDDTELLPRIRAVAAASSLDSNYIMDHIVISPARADRSRFGKATVTIYYDLNKKSFFPFFKPGVVHRSSVVMLEK